MIKLNLTFIEGSLRFAWQHARASRHLRVRLHLTCIHDRDHDESSLAQRNSRSGVPWSGNMLKPDEEQSFFDRERDKLAGEITTVCSFVLSCPPATCRLHHVLMS